jgi:hypothetical protein
MAYEIFNISYAMPRTTSVQERAPDLIKICPAKCSGGYESEQRSLYQGQKDCMPEEILEAAKGGLQYCKYCHAVWEDREGHKKLY